MTGAANDPNEKRRRVLRTTIASTWSGTGQVSSSIISNVGLVQHQLSVVCTSVPSAGVLQVYVRPAKSGFWALLGTINLATYGSGQLFFPGVYDGIRLQFSTALVGGGTVYASLASVGTSFSPSPNLSKEQQPRFMAGNWQSWNGTGPISYSNPLHGSYSQHQFAITGGTGTVNLFGRPTGEQYFTQINSDTAAINAAGSIVFFPGLYDAFLIEPVGTVTGAISATVASVAEEQILPILPWQLAASNAPYVISFNGRTGAVTLTSSDVTTALGYTPANPATFISSFKNKIINGTFDWWQRGTSATTTAAATNYLADRWQWNSLGGTTAVYSQQTFTPGQTAVPNNPTHFMRHVVTSVAGTSNGYLVTQPIESVQTLAGLAFSLTFWARADTNRNIAVEFNQSFGTGGSPSGVVTGIAVTTINLTSAWQLFTVTGTMPSIAGKTLGTSFDGALLVNFWMDAGSTYNARTNSLGQQSGTFDFAQIDLEGNASPTAPEFRPREIELAMCQRYYEKSYDSNVAPGTASIAVGQYIAYLAGLASGTYQPGSMIHFRVTKRATPTITLYNPSSGASGAAQDQAAGASISASANNAGTNTFLVLTTAHAANTAYNIQFCWTANAEL
jgi:hypothetical protein